MKDQYLDSKSHHNRYWKLPTYAREEYPFLVPKARMLDRLKKTNCRGLTKMNKAELVALQHRALRGLVCYDSHDVSVKEIRRFIKDRGLNKPVSSRRKDLVQVLSEADENLRFDRLFDLPAELRERIYIFYIKAFIRDDDRAFDEDAEEEHWDLSTRVLFDPAQPPLARVSQQLRREVLPVFYKQCTFGIVLNPRSPSFKKDNLFPSPVIADTASFIRRIPREFNGCIRKVVLGVRLHTWGGETRIDYGVAIDLIGLGDSFEVLESFKGSDPDDRILKAKMPLLKDAVEKSLKGMLQGQEKIGDGNVKTYQRTKGLGKLDLYTLVRAVSMGSRRTP